MDMERQNRFCGNADAGLMSQSEATLKPRNMIVDPKKAPAATLKPRNMICKEKRKALAAIGQPRDVFSSPK